MNNDAVYLIVSWTVKSGYLKEVLSLLQTLIPLSRAEAGNIVYQVFQDSEDTHTLFLYEVYAGKEALQAHRQTDHYQQIVLKQIVPLLETRRVNIVLPAENQFNNL